MPPLRSDDVEGARCVHGENLERSRPGTIRKALSVRYGVKPLFTLGRVVATPSALAAIGISGDDLPTYLAAISPVVGVTLTLTTGRRINFHSSRDSGRYSRTNSVLLGVKIWMITEADRSSTCILLPEEY
jgi:hypothetical protein